jgi:hypothetical protein
LRGAHLVPGLQAFRGDDVALLAVRVLHEGDVGRAVRVVLNGDHTRGLVKAFALEIDAPVELLVAAAAAARGHASVDVAAAGLVLGR